MTSKDIEALLSPQMQKALEQIKELLRKTEDKTLEFQKCSGLHCKKGCGACCVGPHVSTTVIEMMPLAIEIFANGQEDEFLVKVAGDTVQGQCIFYKPDPHIPGNGRCGIYAHRPGVCRLFGFSSSTDKRGKNVLSTCKVIKESFPQDYAHAQELIEDGLASPSMSGYTFTISSIDPLKGAELYPINYAIKEALEYVGLILKHSCARKGKEHVEH